MRILVYGAGAVGCYLGGHLASAGHSVTLLGREALAAAVRQNGLQLNLVNGPLKVQNIKAVTSLELALKDGPFDWIAFTMKAYDTVPAIHELQQASIADPIIACFQNGIGNEESIRAAFGDQNVVAATVTTPVSIVQPGIITEEKQRGIALASDTPAIQKVHEAFVETRLNVKVLPDSASLKWSKLLLNILANAIPAILDRSPLEVYDDPQYFSLEMAALREAVTVARFLGIRLANLPGVPAGLLAFAVQTLPKFVLRSMLVDRVVKGRGRKPPSLLLALKSGSKRTEVAWLNGGIAQAVQSKDRLAPLNHAIALTLSDIAAGRESWDLFRNDPSRLLTIASTAQGLRSWRYGE